MTTRNRSLTIELAGIFVAASIVIALNRFGVTMDMFVGSACVASGLLAAFLCPIKHALIRLATGVVAAVLMYGATLVSFSFLAPTP